MDKSPGKGTIKISSPVKDEYQLMLTGAPVCLVSRSHQGILRSPTVASKQMKSRPSSAVPSSERTPSCRQLWKRPLSADNGKLSGRRNQRPSQRCDITIPPHFTMADEEDDTIDERMLNLRNSYTVSSSRLLRSLIKEPWDSELSEVSSSSDTSRSDMSLGRRIQQMAQSGATEPLAVPQSDAHLRTLVAEFRDTESEQTKLESQRSSRTGSTLCVQDLCRDSLGRDELLDMKFQRWFQHSERSARGEEKTVRFMEEEEEEEEQKPPSEDAVEESGEPSADLIDLSSEVLAVEDWICSKGCSFSCCQVPVRMKSEEESSLAQGDSTLAHTAPQRQEQDDTGGLTVAPSGVPSTHDSATSVKTPRDSGTSVKTPRDSGTSVKTPRESATSVKTPRDSATSVNTPCDSGTSVKTPRDSTYEDLVSILNVLEKEEGEGKLTEWDVSLALDIAAAPVVSASRDSSQLRDLLSYLDEVERCSEAAIDTAKSPPAPPRPGHAPDTTRGQADGVPRVEELLNRNTVELAHEVLCLKLQVEDQREGIRLLQQTLAEGNEAAKAVALAHQEALCKATTAAEDAVQRHQKFIKQLLNEKKALNEKVTTLVEDLRSSEDRYQKNMKAVEERHTIEIQRVKETQAVAEKIKREKWIDVKTQKIKEMTVKGLEPELSRMAARQQQEMAELRSLQRAELEAVELKNTKRTAELLEQLRSDLTREKEEAVERETAALRARLEKKLEEEMSNVEHLTKKLRDEVRREREKLEAQESQMQDTLMEARRSFERERERDRQRVLQESQERADQAERRHQAELKAVKDSLEVEKEAWVTNYKKQQTAKFLEREAELHHQYKRERDRDIELVIERLENEATQARLELTQAAESKLRRLRDKMEGELKEAEASEAAVKAKLSETKAQLAAKEDHVVELDSQYRHLHTEMAQLKKLCKEMSAERAQLKEILRSEFHQQLADSARDVEAVKNEMAALKTMHAVEMARRDQLAIQERAEAQKELNQVYSRVRVMVSKKDDSLEALREQHRTTLARCSHLEQMLESQRRNLLLK